MQTFIAFDLETTGLVCTRDRIVEIAAIRFLADGTDVDTFQSLVNPGCPIPPDATAIHGITDDDVREAPVIGDVLPRFLAWLGPVPVPAVPELAEIPTSVEAMLEATEPARLEPPTIMLAHNAPFDMGFLDIACEALSLPPVPWHVHCTMQMARRHHGRRLSLSTLAERYGISPEGAHRAMADCRMVKGVFLAMRSKAAAELRNEMGF